MSDRRESPELALLLHAAASDGTLATQHRTRELVQAVANWPLFLERAAQHAVIPLMDYEIGRNAADLVAPETMSRLRAAAQEGAMRSLRLTGDLVAVHSALVSAGVGAIPFKGPTLAALVYGNLSLRQFEDLDILVRDRELSRARDALFAVGFSPVLQLSDDQRASIVLSGHHEQLRHPESGTTVELHWSLNNRALTHDAF
ncbi:MAG TPA: nucleotidyltransferase family protein, partial [Gemmatimonadaceae bacterium]|nr:nucleotidyltransferase family protein [Gemmatimonadaceae bacterium]